MKYLVYHLADIEAQIRVCRRMYLLLDFDGTLAPILSDPQKVVLSERMSRVLRSLTKTSSCILAIVSGRALRDVRRRVGINGIYYMGNHGLEISGERLNYTNRTAMNYRSRIRQVSHALQPVELLGATIEDKGFTVTVHFRRAPTRNISAIITFVTALLREHPQLHITTGKKFVEILPRANWNKGLAVEWLIRQLGGGLPIYVGDDLTDEDAFFRLSGGITVLVSRRRKATSAEYYVNNVTDVYNFLKVLSSWVPLQAGTRHSAMRPS